jgi:cell division FtsZ-interacting protein ZapD
VRDCGCRLPNLAGWAECPQEARRRRAHDAANARHRDEFESNLVHETSRASGFTGDQCSNCGSMQMVYNGTCMLCLSCGQTSGCS